MMQTKRHKVFISYHHQDQKYRDKFVTMMDDAIVDKSVGDGLASMIGGTAYVLVNAP